MRKTKTQKGITLIALIITIVVLLILAVVAINSIQNDGILGHAQNAAETYNQAVANEQAMLQEYQDFLTGANKGFQAYHIGNTVKVLDKNGVEHNFYVIAESDESQSKVTLMAKECINTKTLLQGAPNNVIFSEEGYWGEVTSSPYDIKEETFPIPESHIAAKAAYDYGELFGVTTGRLLTYNEAVTLGNDNPDMIYDVSGYWLGSATDSEYVYQVEGPSIDNIGSLTCWDFDGSVRPVIEISKSKLTAVTK